MSPFFSIVIPTYNRVHLLPRTLETIYQQTFTDFEVIVVDDGSRDGTEKLFENHNYPRLRYFKKENGERGAARNFGAQKSEGRFVSFFDSDDEMYPHHLETAHRWITERPCFVFYYFHYNRQRPDGKPIAQPADLSGDLKDKIIFGNLFSCNGVIIDRETALKNPFIEDRKLAAHEDFELWVRMLARYPVSYCNERTTAVIIHDERSVFTMKKEQLIARLDAFCHYLFQDPKVQEVYGQFKNRVRADADTYIALHLAETKQHRSDTVKYLLHAMVTYPPILKQRRFWAALKRVF